ncbi:DUF1800 domain-containing protein [Oleiharenicola sp. Vm1]|uniref:DUF1800 domain-containing protein n=1 Tax=Oleiharenicola sp. Vm1 TaxID=3398393 RepID=UPI0039F4A0BA
MTRAPRALLAALFSLGFAGAAAAAVSPDTNLTADEQASRFLAQATFGPTSDAIAELRQLGYNYSAWFDLQASRPQTKALDILAAARAAGSFTTSDKNHNRRARTQVMLTAPDQLRQRVAYALSQILVVSDADTTIANAGDGSSSWWDMLARNALGNFKTLMLDVTRHPMMGRYLSHYKNRKANPATGTRPDENYAREVMQLFTIGLYQLNANGTYVTDGTGRPLETYTNDNITEFARVFTGFTDESTNNTGTGTGRTDFPSATADYTSPMRMWEGQHDTGAKTLLAYAGARKPNLPAGQAGLADVSDALDNLIEHPSCAPFISRLLIQRLVTSNPSDAYVGRVAAVFANNGAGVRGDLLAVVKAILLDNEARGLAMLTDPEHGKLREPFLRLTHVLRAFKFTLAVGTTVIPYDLGAFTESSMGQFPLGSPSVFNFYSPDYEPPGAISNARLVGPEFQILNAVTAVAFPNALNTLLNSGTGNMRLDLSAQEALAASPEALLDNLDLLLTHGTLSADSRTKILAAVNGITAGMVPNGSNLNQQRARLAVYLVTLSPDYAILK